jgi:hypothetical protein
LRKSSKNIDPTREGLSIEKLIELIHYMFGINLQKILTQLGRGYLIRNELNHKIISLRKFSKNIDPAREGLSDETTAKLNYKGLT